MIWSKSRFPYLADYLADRRSGRDSGMPTRRMVYWALGLIAGCVVLYGLAGLAVSAAETMEVEGAIQFYGPVSVRAVGARVRSFGWAELARRLPVNPFVHIGALVSLALLWFVARQRLSRAACVYFGCQFLLVLLFGGWLAVFLLLAGEAGGHDGEYYLEGWPITAAFGLWTITCGVLWVMSLKGWKRRAVPATEAGRASSPSPVWPRPPRPFDKTAFHFARARQGLVRLGTERSRESLGARGLRAAPGG
ncbi:MAG: hypothetical protein JXR37_04310 [Kiritimatiellae bacterium]|nr:hypothetical protein [Kiritimatiellia bacterium]